MCTIKKAQTVIAVAGLCFVAIIHPVLAGELVPDPAGGWQSRGLPYKVRIAKEGYVESLVVGGFDYLAATARGPRGFYLADGSKSLPFTQAKVHGDTLTASNANGKLVLRFRATGVDLTLTNRSISDGHCLRLGLSRKLARIRLLGRATEPALPLKRGLHGSAIRFIGANGSSITLGETSSYHLGAAGIVLPAKTRYEVKMPYVRSGREQTFHLRLAAPPHLDDGIRVTATTNRQDNTFWTTTEPCILRASCANVAADQPFNATLVLRLRNYLTGIVTREQTNTIALKGGETKVFSWRLKDLPPMLYMAEIWVERHGRKGLCASPRIVYHANAISPPPAPEDFDAFWKRTLAEQKKIPLDLKLNKVKDQGQHQVYKFSFAGLLGYRCYGWLTLPKDKSKKWPGVLVLPPAGMRSQPIPIFKDAVGMRININTVDVDLPEDQYEWRTWPAPYLVTGILDKDHYCLRFGYAALVRAAEVLAARPEVDARQIRVEGSSQGGGLSIIAAGLYQGFESAAARKPGLCRLDWNLDYLQPPFFPIAVSTNSRQMIHSTLKYFLPCHFARHIKCPINISLGIYDDVTPGVSVFCAYNAIPATTKKRLEVDPRGAH